MDEDRTVVNTGQPPAADATQGLVFGDATVVGGPAGNATVIGGPGGNATMALDLSDRTQMAATLECPVCHSNNPPGETYCGDCGFLLSSRPGAVAEEPQAPVARLVAADGREFGLNAGRNTVGRQGTDVLLPDPTISRQHAVVALEGNRCWVEDLGSTNGTLVDGQRLAPNQPRDLTNGAEVTFGSVAMRAALPEGFVAATPPAAAATAAPALPASSPARLVSEETDAVYPLPTGTTTVGRRSANMMPFPADRYMSGRHAEITFDGGLLTLMDLGSTNGTVVNDEKVAPNVPVALCDGDVVVIGQERFRVRLDDGGEAVAAGASDWPAPDTVSVFRTQEISASALTRLGTPPEDEPVP